MINPSFHSVLFIAALVTAVPLHLLGDEFQYELKEPELKAAMTGKEAALYAKAEKEFSKTRTEWGATKILFQNDKSLRGTMEKQQKAFTEAQAILTNIETGVRSRVEAAIPSSRIAFASVPTGLNIACTKLENFVATTGINDLRFVGIWVWKNDRPQMSPELSDAVYARLAESKMKLSRPPLAVLDSSGKPVVSDFENACLLMGEVVDAPPQSAKLVSLRIIDAKRMAVIKSYSWFVPQKAGTGGAVRAIFNDERASFYKSFVLAHEMKLIQSGSPTVKEAYFMALTKQMFADCPNCELTDAPFMAATFGTSGNGKGREGSRAKMETFALVSEKEKFYLELAPSEGLSKPVRIGGIEAVSVK